jgi:hypothetical protein
MFLKLGSFNINEKVFIYFSNLLQESLLYLKLCSEYSVNISIKIIY